jgi:hypothetical protein
VRSEVFVRDQVGCARCDRDGHKQLVYLPFTYPVVFEKDGVEWTATHWAVCPETKERAGAAGGASSAAACSVVRVRCSCTGRNAITTPPSPGGVAFSNLVRRPWQDPARWYWRLGERRGGRSCTRPKGPAPTRHQAE